MTRATVRSIHDDAAFPSRRLQAEAAEAAALRAWLTARFCPADWQARWEAHRRGEEEPPAEGDEAAEPQARADAQAPPARQADEEEEEDVW